MSIIDYLKGKTAYIICHISIAAVTVLMLIALTPAGGSAFAVLVGVLYFFGAFIPMAIEYHRKKTFYDSLISVFDSLERKNLITAMISPPDFFEGALLYDVLRASNKSCLEEINRYKDMQVEYREYIEIWVHEIKTPIASSKLIAQNNRGEISASILEELEMIEGYVEQALYYARSSAVENDYMIRSLCLEKPIFTVLKRDSKELIRAGISVRTNNLDLLVNTDSKWLEFMLHQLIINSIKYARDEDAYIELSAVEQENRVVLSVSDNGLGIPEGELTRIFDKGFTGTNGRLRGKSTGMGLYICKKLCDKLGISISADSIYGGGTTIAIVFPKSSMTDIVK